MGGAAHDFRLGRDFVVESTASMHVTGTLAGGRRPWAIRAFAKPDPRAAALSTKDQQEKESGGPRLKRARTGKSRTDARMGKGERACARGA
jgi:hypothetical protein